MNISNRWEQERFRIPRRVKTILTRSRRHYRTPRELRDLARWLRKARRTELALAS